ncbi:MAG: substrate-binding domain-containing protein [Lachnospiraceae bacterium]|nr:substrate-binding domain-containing protein [Lachnospiraceae bacterium]MDD7326254.1 substrate-binding domain-containing protein [Lachnospiraceae bacterium]MDY2759000.1 substrate-binding domain-containing protein [Lachnospiraceae bacterium]
MKKSGRTFVIIELILAAFAILCIVMMVRSRSTPEKKKIAVIVEDSENDIWSMLKEGTQEAAKEKNVDIRFVTTGTFENAADEIDAVDDAVRDGCDGLLIYPINEMVVQQLKKRNYHIPVLLMITDSEYDVRSINCDPVDTGRNLAQMIIDNSGSMRTIGIITDRRYSRIARQVKAEIDKVLKPEGYRESFIVNKADEDYIRNHRTDVLLCLDEEAITTASSLVSENKIPGTTVYGCGFSPKDIYQLDMENIKGLAYLDIFKVGYYGVSEIADRVHGNLSQPRSRTVKNRILGKSDIFNEKNMLYTFGYK